jgi:hypothetical protein
MFLTSKFYLLLETIPVFPKYENVHMKWLGKITHLGIQISPTLGDPLVLSNLATKSL